MGTFKPGVYDKLQGLRHVSSCLKLHTSIHIPYFYGGGGKNMSKNKLTKSSKADAVTPAMKKKLIPSTFYLLYLAEIIFNFFFVNFDTTTQNLQTFFSCFSKVSWQPNICKHNVNSL
jgi:hypothetical protein